MRFEIFLRCVNLCFVLLIITSGSTRRRKAEDHKSKGIYLSEPSWLTLKVTLIYERQEMYIHLVSVAPSFAYRKHCTQKNFTVSVLLTGYFGKFLITGNIYVFNLFLVSEDRPITAVARSEVWTVFACSSTGVVVRIPLEAWMSVCVYSVFVLFCV
jgi:hypothetical protein